MSRAYDPTNLFHNSQNSSTHMSSLAMSRRVSDLMIGKSKVRLNSREQGIFPSLPESLAKTDTCFSGLPNQNSLFPPLYFGALAMMTAALRKTSLENEHLRNCDYFAIIPSFSHSTILAKYATNGLVCAPLN